VGFLPDAIICSSNSLWYAWCNGNSNKDICKINMCGLLGTQNRGHLIIVELCKLSGSYAPEKVLADQIYMDQLQYLNNKVASFTVLEHFRHPANFSPNFVPDSAEAYLVP
jgi:hypothetical protein